MRGSYLGPRFYIFFIFIVPISYQFRMRAAFRMASACSGWMGRSL
jgi:hypothetical protein